MSDGYTIRPITSADAALAGYQRAAMFRDMGMVRPEDFDELRAASEAWSAAVLAADQYVGWFVEHGSAVFAGGGALLRERFPVPGCPRMGRWAHVMNMYTEPEHRRRGLARRLMETILEWCTANEMDHVTLAASDEGRPLYESMGFTAGTEMRLTALHRGGLHRHR